MLLGFSSRNKRKHARKLCAYGCVALMLCQIGSHLLLDSHGHEIEEHPVVFLHDETDHHDSDRDSDCEFAIECSDEHQDDDWLPNLQDENNHHHMLTSASLFRFVTLRRSSQRQKFAQPDILARTKAPPYLPPKHLS